MTKEKKQPQKSVSEAIRAEIVKIPASELVFAKPSRILPCLETAGYEITPSVRSTTSKLLAKHKKKSGISERTGIISVDPIALEQQATIRTDLAMRFVEACGCDFDAARAELARLEQFARKFKGA